MVSLSMHFAPFFDWLVRTTLQASLLVCLILLIQAVLGNKLGVRGRYCLWLVLLIRMALPWAPASRVSVHNLLPRLPGQRQELSIAESASVGTNGSLGEGLGPVGPAADGVPETTSASGLTSQESSWLEARVMIALSLCWLGGACVLAGCIMAGNVRLWCVVRRGRLVTDRKILDLLEDCQKMIGTRTAAGVVATDRIGSPALFGLVRPRLLLPRDTLAEMDANELRYIFLHELAHLKRHDILISHVASMLGVLHWFNPLIGLGFQRMRADRELACDALALSLLGRKETSAYGRTVVRQIEQLLTSRRRAALMGLCGVRARIKQRVAMIARFRKETYRWSPLTIVLVGCLAWAGLTNGRADDKGRRPAVRSPEAAPLEVDKPIESREPGDAPATAYKEEYANIVRIHIRHRQTGRYLVANGGTVSCDATDPGDTGLWEARFDGSLGHSDDVFLFSVATGKYLTTDAQGNLATDQLEPNARAYWNVRSGPMGIWVKSREFKNTYVSLDEQDQVKAAWFNRDERGCWDIDQLEKIK